MALMACSGSSGDAPSGSIVISGIASSGMPVAGTSVIVTDANGTSSKPVITDATGAFKVDVSGMQAPFVLTAAFTEVDGHPGTLSSVVNGSGQLHANLNPLTSLITQRVVGKAITGAVSANGITDTAIASATSAVMTPLQPLLTGLNVPAAQGNPISASMVANPSADALDNLIDVSRINVAAGTLVVGMDADRVVVKVPAAGAVDNPSVITPAAVKSVQTMLAGGTSTPITNVIVIVGENQTFDGLFGTYQPGTGQTVNNLLSQGIVNADGSPGANYALAAQNQGVPASAYTINPRRGSVYATLPQPLQIGIVQPCTQVLCTAGGVADPRFPTSMQAGPFPISKYVPYVSGSPFASETGDPVHRFFQMWQQTGGDNAKLDMFVWPAVTVGQGGDTVGITASNPGQGGELMGFVNMAGGDAAFFKSLAQQYAISDNHHQWVMGGTGMNFFSIATGDLPYYNENGVVAKPPENQIENPDPVPGTQNFYKRDGYSGGSYVKCADASQPGVGEIQKHVFMKGNPSNCEPDKYYLVNNYNPGYDMAGNLQPIGPNNYNYPPQTVPTIAEALAAKGISWKWYTGARDAADVSDDAAAFGVPVAVAQAAQYNNLGDPLTASKNVMTNPALKANLAGLTTLSNDIAKGTLPAVSYVVPKNLNSGHPGYSIVAAYEQFVGGILKQLQANPKLAAHTAVLITTDEGGGHFDSGYIQNIDFFGDGPRIPMIVVSQYARKGHVDHVYHDHSSVLKFIERNWRLPPLSPRSRDNLPNPVALPTNLYRPVNRAIGDLTTMFAF
ncbi:hypothetical protein KSF73_07935 [Burkholderiaceae bacterium DAT-1]|nr:hypothetical protein [Burkholderiaceae bacterium DAT-1]